MNHAKAGRQIVLNAFDMACVGHIQQGMWTHPRDHSTGYLRLDHWMRLAQTLERGLFDGLFLADVLGVYDVYAGNPDAALRNAAQTPANEPLMLIPAMAAVTEFGWPGSGKYRCTKVTVSAYSARRSSTKG